MPCLFMLLYSLIGVMQCISVLHVYIGWVYCLNCYVLLVVCFVSMSCYLYVAYYVRAILLLCLTSYVVA